MKLKIEFESSTFQYKNEINSHLQNVSQGQAGRQAETKKHVKLKVWSQTNKPPWIWNGNAWKEKPKP